MDYTRRNLLKSASALLAAPLLERVVFSETPEPAQNNPVRDPLSYVNPEFRAPLAKFPSYSLDAKVLEILRAREKSAPSKPLLPGVSEHWAPGSNGAPKVRLYVAGNVPGASKPAIFHIHGGGMVLGSGVITQDDIDTVNELDCVMVSVDYRLAPEAKFHGISEDNYAGLRWMNENAKTLGIDPTRIAVKGESAGGGLAAMLAIAVRDRKEFTFCQQVLIYPMLDDHTGSTRKLPPYLGHYIWTPQSNQFGWSSFLGVPAGSKTVPKNSVPARVQNLGGLAPAFVGVGSIDLFAPEDIEYSRRLIEAGVSTELMVVPGGYHGFDLFCPHASLTKEFRNAWSSALRRAFAKDSTSS